MQKCGADLNGIINVELSESSVTKISLLLHFPSMPIELAIFFVTGACGNRPLLWPHLNIFFFF